MLQRRKFIKSSLLLAGGLAVKPDIMANVLLPKLDSPPTDDEKYWTLVREQFPLEKNRIFLNNGTIGPSPYKVIESIQNEMYAIESTARYGGNEEDALNALGRFLGAKSSEISFTRNVTEGINIACWGFPLVAGDEVIITNHEHVGHALPWLNRAKLDGIVLKVISLGKTAEETIEIIKKNISKKTKLISVPHIPCTIGQVLPVKEICALAKQHNIFSLIDGAHPAGMISLNISEIGCDAYAGCCHKWMLGPKGTGFLYINENSRDKVQAYYGGAGVDTGWDLLTNPPTLKSYVNNGHRYYYGTHNAASFKGITAAIEFQETIGKELIEKRVKSLANYLQEHLIKLSPEIEMLTPTETISKAAQISFKIKNKDVQKLHQACNSQHIITRYVPENNINCMRVSTHIYNNFNEIDTFLKEVDKFVSDK